MHHTSAIHEIVRLVSVSKAMVSHVLNHSVLGMKSVAGLLALFPMSVPIIFPLTFSTQVPLSV